MTLHPIGPADPGAACAEAGTPIRWRVHTAGFRLPAGEKAAQFKTCNKLVQVLARAEAEAADADEALLLNTDGFVVEAASGNLLWIREGAVCTPPIASGILPGVTREVVQALCSGLKLPCLEADIRPAELRRAEAVFITLSSHGIVEVTEIDGARAGASPITGQLYRAYLGQIRAECGGGPAESVCTWPF